MLTKWIAGVAFITCLTLAVAPVSADISQSHAHFRVMQLAADVQSVSVTLEDLRTVVTDVTPGSMSDYMLYSVNRSSFITLGIAGTGGLSLIQDWLVPPLAPGYHTGTLVGSSTDGTLDMIFIHEDSVCELALDTGSCIIVVNNIKGSPPLRFMVDNAPVLEDATYRHAVISEVNAGTYADFSAVDATNLDVVVFELQSGFFEPNVIYLYGASGNYPGVMFSDYTIGVTRRVPVDMMTFLRGMTADLQLTDGETLFATENMVAIVEAAGYDALLSNPQQALTVFAPIDQAILDVDPALYACVTTDPNAMEALVLNHVLVGNYTSSELIDVSLLPTMAGTTHSFLPAEGGFLMDNSVQVQDALGYPAVNGNVYLTDTVLIPEGFLATYCEVG